MGLHHRLTVLKEIERRASSLRRQSSEPFDLRDPGLPRAALPMLHAGYGMAMALKLRLAPDAVLRTGEARGGSHFLQFIWEGAGAALGLCTHASLVESRVHLEQLGCAEPGALANIDTSAFFSGLPPSLRSQASYGYGRMLYRLTGELYPAVATGTHLPLLDLPASRRGAALEYLIERGPGFPQLLQDPANDDGTDAWRDALTNLLSLDAWCFPAGDVEVDGTTDSEMLSETRARALRYHHRGWPPPIQFGRLLS